MQASPSMCMGNLGADCQKMSPVDYLLNEWFMGRFFLSHSYDAIFSFN